MALLNKILIIVDTRFGPNATDFWTAGSIVDADATLTASLIASGFAVQLTTKVGDTIAATAATDQAVIPDSGVVP